MMMEENNRGNPDSGHKKARTGWEKNDEVIKFKVGGLRFQMERGYLSRYPNSFLATMLREGNRSMLALDENGYVTIDRDGRAFIYILQYYTTGDIDRAIAEVQGSMMEVEKNGTAFNPTSQTTTPFLDPITWAVLESDLDFYFPGDSPKIRILGGTVAKKSKELLKDHLAGTVLKVFKHIVTPSFGKIRYYFDRVFPAILECMVMTLEDVVGRALLFSIVQDTKIKLSGILISIGSSPPQDWVGEAVFGDLYLQKTNNENLYMSFLPSYSRISIDDNEFPAARRIGQGYSNYVKFASIDVFSVLSPHFSIHRMLADMIDAHLSAMLSKKVEVSWSSPCAVKEGIPLKVTTGLLDEPDDGGIHEHLADSSSPPMNMIKLDLTFRFRQRQAEQNTQCPSKAHGDIGREP